MVPSQPLRYSLQSNELLDGTRCLGCFQEQSEIVRTSRNRLKKNSPLKNEEFFFSIFWNDQIVPNDVSCIVQLSTTFHSSLEAGVLYPFWWRRFRRGSSETSDVGFKRHFCWDLTDAKKGLKLNT